MYYSKSSGSSLSIPRNYSGNTFRVIDETERERSTAKEISQAVSKDETFSASSKDCCEKSKDNCEKSKDNCEKSEQKNDHFAPLSALFSSVSVEDLLLLGLIFVIHQDNPNDSTLLLLLILLLTK